MPGLMERPVQGGENSQEMSHADFTARMGLMDTTKEEPVVRATMPAPTEKPRDVLDGLRQAIENPKEITEPNYQEISEATVLKMVDQYKKGTSPEAIAAQLGIENANDVSNAISNYYSRLTRQ